MTKPAQSDYGPPERGQHGDVIVLEETARAGMRRARVRTQLPLDRYHAHGQLGASGASQRLYDAGIRLHSDYHLAGIEQRVISNYDEMISEGSVQVWGSLRVDAYRRVNAALRAVGPIASNEVLDACCVGKPIGRERMEILRRGLDELAKHYGY